MNRLEKLAARRTIPAAMRSFSSKELNEVYCNLQKSDGIKYAVGAMQPISEEYTTNTIAQGERVRNQLDSRLTKAHDFEYQGSVTNDTHIKANSDIDLLVITPKFVTLEHPQAPKSPYGGNPIVDMKELRQDSEHNLKVSFPAANVDTTGSKSIAIEGGSLSRKVDVVPANWHNSNHYASTGSKTVRGIRVFNKNTHEFIVNYPFLHNWNLQQKDSQTQGGLCRAIRLMKSLMYDNDLEISSYDIAGIAYNIPNEKLGFNPPFELEILDSCLDFCKELEQNIHLQISIEVPNSTRTVFDSNEGASLQHLQSLTSELQQLKNDILTENIRSFSKLAEARVEHPLQIQSFF